MATAAMVATPGMRTADWGESRWKWRRLMLNERGRRMPERCDKIIARQTPATATARFSSSETNCGDLGDGWVSGDRLGHIPDKSIQIPNQHSVTQDKPVFEGTHREVQEQLLLIGGVEPNPGPTEKIYYEGWSRDASRFLWPSIGAVETSINGRLKRLLKYFDPRTKGGSMVFAGVNAIMDKTDDQLKEQFFPDLEGNLSNRMRWECVKKNLDALLPGASALDAEAELKTMSKDSKESLLQFICRFQATIHWYSADQLNSRRAAHILLRKLPQALQRRLASESFDSLSVEFIYQKAQDYMNWLSVSPTGWKDTLGDFMDLDSCAVHGVSPSGDPEPPAAHAMDQARHPRPVLDRDLIRWQNIDGPRSLMVAWKKLISTSSRFQQESREFLQRRPGYSHQRHRGAILESLDQAMDGPQADDDFGDDDDPIDTHDISFAEWEDVEADPSQLHAVDIHPTTYSPCEADDFLDCLPETFFTPPSTSTPAHCTTIEDLHSTQLSSLAQTDLNISTAPVVPETCRAVTKPEKKSLHVPIEVCGKRIMALVDTGATSCFVQLALAKKLGVWDRHTTSTQRVRYANGVVEPVLGTVPLDFTLQHRSISVPAYVLQGKGPALILGFTFLEQQGLLVDCAGRQLLAKASAPPVPCFPSTLVSSPPPVKVRRFRIDGQLPLLPQRKYGHDAGVDIFAPRAIHLRPGERTMIDTGLACAFPSSHWCWIRDKSSLATRHGLTVLGGIVDSNYRGRIQVILLNTGRQAVTIPRFAPFCQAILMPHTISQFQEGPVPMDSDRGGDAALFQPSPLSPPTPGNFRQRVPRPTGTR